MKSLVHRASIAPLHYREFQIPKRNGTMRDVREPNPELKAIQREILDTVLCYLPSLPHAYGFVKGRSIIDNARLHLNREFVVNMDLAEFFHSITHTRVNHVFVKAGMDTSSAKALTRACVTGIKGWQGQRLSQGAPTSPCLANHSAGHLDRRLATLARHSGFRYSRYADDITFSGDDNPRDILRVARTIIVDEGFLVNAKKTTVAHSGRPQLVTGIRVDKGRLRPSQELLAAYSELMHDPNRTRAQVTGMQQFLDTVYRLNKGIE